MAVYTSEILILPNQSGKAGDNKSDNSGIRCEISRACSVREGHKYVLFVLLHVFRGLSVLSSLVICNKPFVPPSVVPT